MAKKKVNNTAGEEVEIEVEQAEAPTPDPVALKAAQILTHITNDMMFEGVLLDPHNPDHLIVAAWLVGRGGWLRK